VQRNVESTLYVAQCFVACGPATKPSLCSALRVRSSHCLSGLQLRCAVVQRSRLRFELARHLSALIYSSRAATYEKRAHCARVLHALCTRFAGAWTCPDCASFVVAQD
jgi:hypothetical protein